MVRQAWKIADAPPEARPITIETIAAGR